MAIPNFTGTMMRQYWVGGQRIPFASPYTAEINHMTVRSLSQKAYIDRVPLKEGRNFLIHERYFSLEPNFHWMTRLDILLTLSRVPKMDENPNLSYCLH